MQVLEQKAMSLSQNKTNPIKLIRNLNDSEAIDLFEIFCVNNKETIEKIDANLETLKDLFEDYASIGDKLDFSFMNFSGFTKFLKDANLIKQPSAYKPPSDLSMSIRSMSNSRLKALNGSNSKALLNHSQSNFLKKSPSTFSSVFDGKLRESEISIVFSQICGQSNFNSETSNEKALKAKTPNFRSNNCIAVQHKPSSFQMNFALFLKSLEVLALKLHPSDLVEDALVYFFDIDIANILKERNQNLTAKQNILEVVKYLKRDEIIELMVGIGSVLLPHYKSYCTKEGLISLNCFYE